MSGAMAVKFARFGSEMRSGRILFGVVRSDGGANLKNFILINNLTRDAKRVVQYRSKSIDRLPAVA